MIYADKELMKLTKKELIDLVEEYTDDKKHMFGQIHKFQLDLNDLSKASEPLSTEVKSLKRRINSAIDAAEALIQVNHYDDQATRYEYFANDEDRPKTSAGYRELMVIKDILLRDAGGNIPS